MCPLFQKEYSPNVETKSETLTHAASSFANLSERYYSNVIGMTGMVRDIFIFYSPMKSEVSVSNLHALPHSHALTPSPLSAYSMPDIL